MQKWVKVSVCLVLSFAFLFTCVGFSAMSDTLTVKGYVEVAIPSGLFIIGMTSGTPSLLDKNEYSYIQYSTTVISDLSKSTSRNTGSVTYQVTVLNNTKYEYAWRGLYYQSSVSGYNNEYVSTSNSNSKLGVTVSFPNGKIVGAGEQLTFNVTYTAGKNIGANQKLKTIINYQFGINVESQEAAVAAVHSKFLEILNTPSTYKTLYEAIDDKFDGSQEWTSNYIGNVSNAVDADSMTVETLFAGQLNMVINGQTQPASVLIKHENLDNNTKTGDDYVAINSSNGGRFEGYGCEMTLYLTTDGLTRANGNAPVYVTVFTCDRDAEGNIVGDWYMIGDTYLGKAPIVGYRGESGGTGSFVTDNWVADAATYSPTSNYSYRVASGVTIKDLTRVVDSNATAAFQELLADAEDMIEDLTYAGTGITIVEDAYAAAAPYYTIDAEGNAIADTTVTRAQIIPIMTKLDYALVKAQEAIDEVMGRQ